MVRHVHSIWKDPEDGLCRGQSSVSGGWGGVLGGGMRIGKKYWFGYPRRRKVLNGRLGLAHNMVRRSKNKND